VKNAKLDLQKVNLHHNTKNTLIWVLWNMVSEFWLPKN